MKKMSMSLRVACLLTFVGGFLEIYSYLLKGGVFATTITGDIIRLTHNIFEGKYFESVRYIFPIIGFFIGVVIALNIEKYYEYKNKYWRENVILAEIVIIVIVAILHNNEFDYITNSMISCISAIQIQSFINVKDTTYMSTMCTGNTKKLFEALIRNNKSRIIVFSCIVGSFVLGVIIGNYLLKIYNTNSILFLLIPLFSVYMIIKKDNSV